MPTSPYTADEVLARHGHRIEIDPTTECWRWRGATTKAGYGLVTWDRANHYTHRLFYEAFRGAIPAGLVIDHLCRVPACCNPAHMEAVPMLENTLRGNLIAVTRARHAAKQWCKRGHPLFGDNIFIDGNGARVCRTCLRMRSARRYQRAKEELTAERAA